MNAMTGAQRRRRILKQMQDGATLMDFGRVMGASLVTRDMLGFVRKNDRIARVTLETLINRGYIAGTPDENGWVAYALTPTALALLAP